MTEFKKCSSCVRLPQPIEVFINERGKDCKTCLKCRIKSNTRSLNNKEKDGLKLCSGCKRKPQPIKNFLNATNRECKLCITCRNKSNKQLSKPETIARMKQWRQDNIERVKTRIRESSKKWKQEQLETNREEYKKKVNDTRRLSVSGKILAVKENAVRRNINWEMTDEQAYNCITGPCTYCNYLDLDKVLNGIDRLDSSKSYSYDNCVPCCTHCNLMKGCYDPVTFVQRCRAIGECKVEFPEIEICDRYRTSKKVSTC
jgi:hypothetical protein